MNRSRVMSGVVLALAASSIPACRSGRTPAPAGPHRVVLVSYDGVGADLAASWLEHGVATDPSGIAGMIGAGTWARRLRMVNPTLTSVNHLSLITGALPQDTGIVSNRFHPPGMKITKGASGFSAPIQAETLWEAARRQGKRVAILLWPGADGTTPERSGDVGLVWPGRPLADGEVRELAPAEAGGASVLPSHDGVAALAWDVSLALRATAPDEVTFTLTVTDGSADGVPLYDTVAVQQAGSDDVRVLGRDRWFPLGFNATGPGDASPRWYASWCKVLRLDRRRGAVRLYLGSAGRTVGYPDPFVERMDQAIGPWPGEPDAHSLGRWWLDMGEGIDLDTYLEQLERLDRWLDAAAAQVLAHEAFDLLLAYHPTPDEYQHSSLLVDRRQWAWSPGTELAAREGLKRVGRSFDRSVADLWSRLDSTRDTLVVVSDHGHLPLHDEVRVNQALAEAGLVKVEQGRRGPRAAADTPMLAFASGGCAHLYLNLQGREPGGVVDPARAPELLRRAARALADLEVDGEPVVEEIVTRAEAARLGLASPAAGDLIVFFRPGYAASSRLGGKVVQPTGYYSQHGYLASHDELCGIFFARGAGVPHRTVDELPATSVAPTVARWLGISPPSGPRRQPPPAARKPNRPRR